MKHLELHIIQSVPVACLNRDDLNSPKTAVFGGVQRARVSSQSWKRAIRELAKDIAPAHFQGERTRLLYNPLYSELKAAGLSDTDSEEGAKKIVDELVKLDPKSKDKVRSTTLYFLSPAETKALASNYAQTKDVKKAVKSVNANVLSDAADISIFGRMVASNHSLTVEAASMFSHALSTHKADNEIDFFAAVEERPNDDPGAAITGTLEFNSATYYRFAALNLNMLADDNHLGSLSQSDRDAIVKAFIESTVQAVPGARKSTMNSNTLPAYVLGVIREKGHPIQLVNAFEQPVRHSMKGFTIESIIRLNKEFADIKDTWGIDSAYSRAVVKDGLKDEIRDSLCSITTCSLSELIDGMVKHVI